MAWGLATRDAEWLAGFFNAASEYSSTLYLERVSSRPNQAAQSTWTFARMYERQFMGATCFDITVVDVEPKEWQKFMECPKKPTKDEEPKADKRYRMHKNNLKEHAQSLFPSLRVTQQTSDALLIAEYARRKFLLGRDE